MMKHILLMTVPAAFLVAGCTPYDAGIGEVSRWNSERQIIDPDPQYAGTPIEGGSGERAASAVDRYNRGEVIKPTAVDTTVATTGTSGSRPR